MKKMILILLIFAKMSNAWAQMPTSTPAPNLIFKSSNLNDNGLISPLKVYFFQEANVAGGRKCDIEIVDDRSTIKTIFDVYPVGTLWGASIDSTNGIKKGDIFLEEFKVSKKIDSNSCLVKLPIPNNQKWRYANGDNNILSDIFGGDHEQTYYLTSESGFVREDSLKNGDSVNVVARVEGYFAYEEHGKSENFIKLNVVPPDESAVWSRISAPSITKEDAPNKTQESNTPQNYKHWHFDTGQSLPSSDQVNSGVPAGKDEESNRPESAGSELYDEQYRFLLLGQEGTRLKAQVVAGTVKVVQKINPSSYLVSFEFQGQQAFYYLTNAKKMDAVDDQSVFIEATVVGTKSYTTVLGGEKTVVALKLKALGR